MVKWLGTDKITDNYYWGPEVALATINHEHMAAVTDCLVMCCMLEWGTFVIMPGASNRGRIHDWADMVEHSPNGGPEYLSAIFGRNVTWEELTKQGERVVNLARAVWVRDGYTEAEYDTYWDAIFETTDAQGRPVIPKDKFEQTMQDYYSQRGWKDGVPTRAKLEELDLKYVADELEALGKLPA